MRGPDGLPKRTQTEGIFIPWQASDAKRFKKGLTDKQAKTWAAVANSTLASCQKDGGKDCEGRAIRAANSSVGESAPQKAVTIRESSFSDYSLAEIQIDEVAQGAGEKREMVVTLLREGPGNKFHNNYYTRKALETTLSLVKSRPKQYFNHAKDVDNPERDIRDWASSIMEAWMDTSEPKAKLKGRVKVLDNWLWERAKIAPGELAVSIEGRGSGDPKEIEGSIYNTIQEITHLNGINWVDYPGNAGMGVEMLESATQKNSTEETDMDKKALIESLKALSREELREAVETNPDLKEFFLFPAEDEGTKKQIAELAEQVKAIKAEGDSKTAALQEQLKAREQENLRMAAQLEAHTIKNREDAKEKMIEGSVKASKLKPEHVTPTFMEALRNVREYKAGDKTVTEADQVKQLIEDREKICIAPVAAAGQSGSSTGSAMTEDEQQRAFSINMFGIDPKIKEGEKDAPKGVRSTVTADL